MKTPAEGARRLRLLERRSYRQRPAPQERCVRRHRPPARRRWWRTPPQGEAARRERVWRREWRREWRRKRGRTWRQKRGRVWRREWRRKRGRERGARARRMQRGSSAEVRWRLPARCRGHRSGRGVAYGDPRAGQTLRRTDRAAAATGVGLTHRLRPCRQLAAASAAAAAAASAVVAAAVSAAAAPFGAVAEAAEASAEEGEEQRQCEGGETGSVRGDDRSGWGACRARVARRPRAQPTGSACAATAAAGSAPRARATAGRPVRRPARRPVAPLPSREAASGRETGREAMHSRVRASMHSRWPRAVGAASASAAP